MARSDKRFNRILDDMRRDEARLAPRSPLVNPLAGAAPPIGEGPRPAFGAEGNWHQALDWIADAPDPAGSAVADTLPSDDLQTIARELGLSAELSLEELTRMRRRFMWANHPDRRADAPRDLANRRVAIANMLIDRARAAIKAGKD